MAATTAPTAPRARPVHARGGGFPGALAAEWTKLRGLRSTWACLGLALAAAAAIALLGAYTMTLGSGTPAMDANSLAPTVILLPQFALITFASLLITGEYATGAIRTTLTTVPLRGTAFAAKAAVLTALMLLSGALIGLASLLISMAVLGSAVQPTTAGLLGGIAGTAGYCAAIGLFVLGLGAVLRSTAGTVASTIAVVVGIPMIATLARNEVLTTISEYSPTSAGIVLMTGGAEPYGPAGAAAVLAAWALGALIAGYALLRARDA